MREVALSLTLFLFGCGSESVAPEPSLSPSPSPSPSPATNANETETAYAIHEWGFIAHHFADGEGELTVGTVHATEHVPRTQPTHHGEGFGGKPVLYVHLRGEGDLARFTASLSTAGRFVEEWPHSEGSTPTRLTWEVEARRESCSAGGRYPVAGDSHCAGIADHYCEAAELAHYETDDSACLTVGGQEWNHLFYRAQVASDLPLRVSKQGDVFTVHSAGPVPGRLMRIQRANHASATRVALFDAPASGESMELPAASGPAASGMAALETELSTLGMSESEVSAFMTAWQAELFGATPERGPVQMVGRPPRALWPKVDALIYFVPAETLDAMVPLDFSPPPAEVHRAILLRVDLGAELAPTPIVRASRVVVGEGLERPAVRLILRQHLNEFSFCAEKHPRPGGGFRLGVQFVVGSDGSVQSTTVENESVELATCLEDAIRHMVFPTPESGVVRVSTTLLLSFPASVEAGSEQTSVP